MTLSDTQFVTDETGQRVAVLVGMDRYRELLDAAEEMASVRAYDEAKQNGGEAISFEQAIREIDVERSSR